MKAPATKTQGIEEQEYDKEVKSYDRTIFGLRLLNFMETH